jgi:hypothetical protein
MNKNYFAIAVGAALLVGAALSVVQPGKHGEQRHGAKYSSTTVVPSRLRDSDATIAFVMQWDERSKRLLFDGQAICHDKPSCFRLNGCNISIEKPFVPPSKCPDRYSFDAGTIGELLASASVQKQDGRIHYRIQWNESKEWFIFDEGTQPRPEDKFLLSGYSSFNSNLDTLDGAFTSCPGTTLHVP